MTDDWAKRRTLLAVNQEYCVQRDASGGGREGSFRKGEKLCLHEINYSRYDNALVFAFEVAGGGWKTFYLGDNEPLERLLETFIGEIDWNAPESPGTNAVPVSERAGPWGHRPARDPSAEAGQLEAEFDLEDRALRLRTAYFASIVILGLFLAAGPLLAGVPFLPQIWPLIGWSLFELPLLTLAVITFRRGTFRMPGGKLYSGWHVRAAAALAVVLPLLLAVPMLWEASW